MASRRIYRNFTKGTMNKQLDERLVPDGQYIDALNVRIDATESANASVVKPAKGNKQLVSLTSKSGLTLLPQYTTCVGSASDDKTGYIYWMIHNSNFSGNKIDMIVGISARKANDLRYIIQSEHATKTALNFSPNRKVTAINIIDGVMYFTDGYNQPKQIILNKTYPNDVTESELLVIKAPPASAPIITPIFSNDDDSFMADKVYCFAYRYKYSNGQYSATSQFSLPALYPGDFSMDDDDSTNAGMKNTASGVKISYNSGPASVTDVELLFKYADSSDIFVITKLNKRKLGIGDNKIESLDFSEEKYVSVLPEYEILRMFDNVPTRAVAQTYMGSRLLYGNYSDGFDMRDAFGRECNVGFSARAVSTELKRRSGHVTSPGTYSLLSPITIPNSTIKIDLSGVSLVAGTMIVIQMDLAPSDNVMQPSSLGPLDNIPDVSMAYSIVLKASYNSVYEFAVSPEFRESIGQGGGIDLDLSQNSGSTFTDAFTAAMKQTLLENGSGDAYDKFSFGVSAPGTPAYIGAIPGSSVVDIQIPAMIYKSSTGGLGYVYYSITSSSVVVYDVVYQKSMHSNRNYQIGIVYMDDYGRSTPALTSNDSSFYLDASKSSTRNQIEVTIPRNQIAPAFASRYKFAIKEKSGNYETIYSNFFFKDPSSRFAYFLLNGENARKVAEDVMLIVKSDSYGPAKSLIQVKVLSKESLAEGVIVDNAPAGVYMKLSTENLNIVDSKVFTNGKISDIADSNSVGVILGSSQDLPKVRYSLNDGTANIAIPQSGTANISIRTSRIGDGSCEHRAFSFEKTITASRSYADFMKLWEGEGMDTLLRTGSFTVGDAEAPELKNVYYPGVSIDGVYRAYTREEVGANITTWVNANYIHNNFYYFVTDDGLLSMEFWGVRMCPGIFNVESRKSIASIDLKIYQTGTYLFVFETEPAKQDIDLFYESSQSFSINKNTGWHNGNESDQTALSPAVVTLDDFNCICFGNGVESFKMKDSLSGRRIYLGSRALSSSYSEVSEADRGSDITYSGVYNDETNVDKLNQFVSGLQNFKNLESSFGDIQVLSGRKTDVMVIQEGKVSYVLTGKNLLSDSVAGGSVSSVPEVLGTQIARLEEYGTTNPESYSHYGNSHLFVDQRNGAVIRIDGDSYQNDAISVVSDIDMQTWFKDEFSEAENTVILSQYDPGNNEFILSTTGVATSVQIAPGDCGASEIITIYPGDVFSRDYVIESGVGDVDIFIRVSTNKPWLVSVLCTGMYGPILFEDGTDDVIRIPITNPSLGYINVTIEGGDPSVYADVYLEVGCLQQREMTITQTVLSSNSDDGKLINVGYGYETADYNSPLFLSDVRIVSNMNVVHPISFQNRVSGNEGSPSIPQRTAKINVYVDYSNDPSAFSFDDINSILVYEGVAESTVDEMLDSYPSITLSKLRDGVFSGEYQLIGEDTSHIHVLYNARKRTLTNIKQSWSGAGGSCCGVPSPSPAYLNDISLKYATAIFPQMDIGLSNPYGDGFYSDLSTAVVVENSVISSRDACPSCSLLCGEGTLTIEDMEVGAYTIPINTLGGTGLMRIRMNFDPSTQWAIGARAIGPDGKVYSTIYATAWIDGAVSPNDHTKPMFFGKSHDACSVTGEYTLNEYQYSAGEITPTGNTKVINVALDQIELHSTVEPFGFSIVVPILSDKDAVVILELYALCHGMTFGITAVCAETLLPVAIKSTASATPCDIVPLTEIGYLGMRGASVAVKDVLFNDMYGASPAPAGVYRYYDGYFTIGDYGQILSITTCAATPPPAVGFASTSVPVNEISACKVLFDATYYNTGGDGIVSNGDVIYRKSDLSDALTVAGVYKYGTGFIVINSAGVVTSVSEECDTPLPSIMATSVFLSKKSAFQSTVFGVIYYDSVDGILALGSVLYLDSSATVKLADTQGIGYIRISQSDMILTIDASSSVIDIQQFILS